MTITFRCHAIVRLARFCGALTVAAKSTHKATRELNEAFPKGTLVEFLDENQARRIGTVKAAKGGRLVIVSPPDFRRKDAGSGLTRDIVRAVQRTFKVTLGQIASPLQREPKSG